MEMPKNWENPIRVECQWQKGRTWYYVSRDAHECVSISGAILPDDRRYYEHAQKIAVIFCEIYGIPHHGFDHPVNTGVVDHFYPYKPFEPEA